MGKRDDAARARLAEMGIQPRGLDKAEAANYCGVPLSRWERLEKEGCIPSPHPILGTYSTDTLDRYLDGGDAKLGTCLVDPYMARLHATKKA